MRAVRAGFGEVATVMIRMRRGELPGSGDGETRSRGIGAENAVGGGMVDGGLNSGGVMPVWCTAKGFAGRKANVSFD